jgi:hypothetical protein
MKDAKYTCLNCQDQRWVCENHERKPWDPDGEQCCGGAGMPCPMCNHSDRDNPPALPPGMIVLETFWH